ncbi:MAG: hypothetical protein AB1606_07735 [Nitrospirota bacterium]
MIDFTALQVEIRRLDEKIDSNHKRLDEKIDIAIQIRERLAFLEAKVSALTQLIHKFFF